jgi:branched-chain amino acid transport system permease protein
VRELTLSSQGLRRAGLITLALAAAYLLMAWAVSNTYVLLIMALLPIWALVGVSWNIFSGYSGLLSFGHAAFFGLGAYTVAVCFVRFDLSPWLGLPLAASVGALASLLIGAVTFRLRGVYFSLAMLAYPLSLLYFFEWLGLQEIALPMKRDNPVAYMQFDNPRAYIVMGVVLLVAAVFTDLRIGRSRFGLSLLAVKQNELAAQAAGINSFRWKLAALVISGALAALAGALYAVLLVIITPHSAFGMLVSAQALIFTMFGGVGHVAGPILGAAILIPLSEVLSGTVGDHLPGIHGVIYGVAIIAVMMLAPEGVLPWLKRHWNARKGARASHDLAASSPGTNTWIPGAAVTERVRRTDGPVVLKAEGLSRHYGGLQAVADVHFEVREGEILGIIGPNGAGKTTLFNLLNRIVPPSSGRVFFQQRDLDGLQPFDICRMGVGRTFQVARPFARLTVLDNVVVGALAAEKDDAQAMTLARDALTRVGLADAQGQLAGSLTAVQLRLMEIARALAGKPRLLLLDEVLAGLGGGEVDQVVQVLRNLSNEGLTIVIIEHTMHVMVRLVDRLLVLNHGKVLTVGEPRTVTSDPAVIEAYLGKKWVTHAANQ